MQRFDGREAADAVLGAALADEEARREALEILRPEMFYRDQDRVLFQAIRDMELEAGVPADLVTVTRWLVGNGRLEAVGGAGRISSLVDLAPVIEHAGHYARMVRSEWARREAIRATKGLEAALASGKPLPEAVREHQVEVSEALEVDGPVRVDFGRAVWEDLQCDRPVGRKVRMPGLDDIGGLLPGIYTLAARPGVGKSTFLSQATVRLIEAGLKVLVVSAEMPRWKWAGWMLSAMTGRPYRDLGWPPDEQFREVLGSPLFGFYRRHGQVLIDDLAAAVRECRPNVLVLDHVGKLESPGISNRANELQRCMNVLHGVALDLEMTVLAAAHLGRDADTGARPRLSNLRESGAIENVSDVVAYLYPGKSADMTRDQVQMEFDCDKNRHFGLMKRVGLMFDRPRRLFVHAPIAVEDGRYR